MGADNPVSGTSMSELGARRRKSETWAERAFKSFGAIPSGTRGVGTDFIQRLEVVLGEKFPAKSTGNFLQQCQRKGFLKRTGDAIEGGAKAKGHFYPEYIRV